MDESNVTFLRPSWPAPARVKALITTRAGGVSEGPYASLNLSYAVGDGAAHVSENRRIIQRQVSVPLVYMSQVHGADVAVVAAEQFTCVSRRTLRRAARCLMLMGLMWRCTKPANKATRPTLYCTPSPSPHSDTTSQQH